MSKTIFNLRDENNRSVRGLPITGCTALPEKHIKQKHTTQVKPRGVFFAPFPTTRES
jgi:hypothetical protein